MTDVPRSEYPRPQHVRPDWLCLNGEWEFEIDQGDSGLERGLLTRPLARRILVPFCPESTLSGVGERDFLNAVVLSARWRYADHQSNAKVFDYEQHVLGFYVNFAFGREL